MKILRYLDPEGNIRYGDQKSPDQVERLEGDPFSGLTPTGEGARVARVLAPVSPAAILCIGLNYRHHAAESGAKPPETADSFPQEPEHPPKPRRSD
jgi:2-keto-4-pentenoate hydratase/2-oxohepta-3-ene-1,7-dioic acid hydratase in catechol pathway